MRVIFISTSKEGDPESEPSPNPKPSPKVKPAAVKAEDKKPDPKNEGDPDTPDWWENMAPEQQREYIKKHPATKFKESSDFKNSGLKNAGVKDLDDATKRKAKFAAKHEVRSILNRTKPEDLDKLAKDLKAMQEGKSRGKDALKMIGSLVGAAALASAAAMGMYSIAPEASVHLANYSTYLATGGRRGSLPEWMKKEADADRDELVKKNKVGIHLEPDEFDDHEAFKEAMAEQISKNLENVNPKVAQALLKQRKKNHDVS